MESLAAAHFAMLLFTFIPLADAFVWIYLLFGKYVSHSTKKIDISFSHLLFNPATHTHTQKKCDVEAVTKKKIAPTHFYLQP